MQDVEGSPGMGAAAYVTKPFELTDLGAKVKEATGWRG